MVELPSMLQACFGRHAPEMMRLVEARPELLTQLASYSVRNLHAVVAWLALAPRPSEAADEIAEMLATTAPRQLLRQALPLHGAETWALFRTLPARPFLASLYGLIDEVARSPAGPLMARLTTTFNYSSLAFFKKLGRLLPEEPLLAYAAKGLMEQPQLLKPCFSALALLRAHGQLGAEADVAAALSQISDAAGFGRFVLRRFARIVVPIPQPLPGSKLRPVRTVGELRALGRRLRNCMPHRSDYAIELLQGRSWFYELIGDTPAAIHLEVSGPGPIATLEQAAGMENADLDEACMERIRDELRCTGIRLLPVGLSGVLYPAFLPEDREDDLDAPAGTTNELAEAA